MLNFFEGLESAIEYFCFDPYQMQLAGQTSRAKGRKKQLIRRFCPEVWINQGNPVHVGKPLH